VVTLFTALLVYYTTMRGGARGAGRTRLSGLTRGGVLNSLGEPPDAFDIEEEFAYNCTPRLRREVRQIIFSILTRLWRPGGNTWEIMVESKTKLGSGSFWI